RPVNVPLRGPAPPAQAPDRSPRTRGAQPAAVLRLALRPGGRFGRGAEPPPSFLVRRKAVEEAVAAGAAQIGLAAAAVRPARGMRRVPRLRRFVVAQAHAVVVAADRRALGALPPVATRPVVAGRKRPAVGLRAGQ